MTQNQVKNFIKKAITKMLVEDGGGNSARNLLNTSERNITAHLRTHLTSVAPQRYQVDHEYNRVGAKGQKPKYSGRLGQNIIPDIIVHIRGVKHAENPKANFLAIEVKNLSTFQGNVESLKSARQQRLLQFDLDKLAALQDPSDQYQYLYAAAVVFASQAVWIQLNGLGFETLLQL